MLLKFAAPLLLFSSSALQTANNASYENTSDQERCVFPIPHEIFPLRLFQNTIPSFFLKWFVAVDIPFFFSASTCKEIFDRNV